jgi:hypothetical protein
MFLREVPEVKVRGPLAVRLCQAIKGGRIVGNPLYTRFPLLKSGFLPSLID